MHVEGLHFHQLVQVSMRTNGQVDEEEDIEFDESGEDHEAHVDQRTSDAHAPIHLELVQCQAPVHRDQRRQQRDSAV